MEKFPEGNKGKEHAEANIDRLSLTGEDFRRMLDHMETGRVVVIARETVGDLDAVLKDFESELTKSIDPDVVLDLSRQHDAIADQKRAIEDFIEEHE